MFKNIYKIYKIVYKQAKLSGHLKLLVNNMFSKGRPMHCIRFTICIQVIRTMFFFCKKNNKLIQH